MYILEMIDRIATVAAKGREAYNDSYILRSQDTYREHTQGFSEVTIASFVPNALIGCRIFPALSA